MKPVILTGLRANNDLTIGNYLGAILPMIDMAKKRAGEYQINMFVPDLHSFTTPIDHTQLQAQIMQNLKVFVAAGLPIDHPDVYIYRQSYVPAHSELTWILDCFARFGVMTRMTQFKEKTKVEHKEALEVGDEISDIGNDIIADYNITKQEDLDKIASLVNLAVAQKLTGNIVSSVGLFNYPVLMAADILLYNTSYVPVGEDQTQHLEFTRDIAERMNNQFGELFTVPLPVPQQHKFFGKDQGLRIRDLQDPTKKMSKSDESGRGVIFMSDTPEAAAKKIMSAATDSFGEIKYDMQERPGVSNLIQILSLLSGRELKEVVTEYEGKTMYGDLKKAVAEAVSSFLSDFQNRLATIDEQVITSHLQSSETAMNDIANATLLRAQKAVGLRP